MSQPDPHAGHGYHDEEADAIQPASPAAGQTAIDPVCGMTVTLKPDTQTERFGGTDFHFCSGKCQTKFKADPSFYASGNAVRRGKVMVAGTQYTCPMHPEIIRDAPGACPICGMALEPLVATSESGPNHELIDMTRRFWIGLARATMANIRQNLFFAFVYNAAGVPSRPAPSIRCSASCSRR